jgi:hypothetical protein
MLLCIIEIKQAKAVYANLGPLDQMRYFPGVSP